jgi:hypothetical protein
MPVPEDNNNDDDRRWPSLAATTRRSLMTLVAVAVIGTVAWSSTLEFPPSRRLVVSSPVRIEDEPPLSLHPEGQPRQLGKGSASPSCAHSGKMSKGSSSGGSSKGKGSRRHLGKMSSDVSHSLPFARSLRVYQHHADGDEDDECSGSAGKMGTAMPSSVAPSQSLGPSATPSISGAPSASQVPSTLPSIMPSDVPSTVPSLGPSASP